MASSPLDRTDISSLEAGKRNVSLVNIYKLAETLRVEARELLLSVSEVVKER